MQKARSLKLVPTNEIQEAIRTCKSKIYNHIEMRNEFQVNESFVNYMEETIEELSKELKQRIAA